MSIASEVNKIFSNTSTKCYNCKFGVLCHVQVDNEGHYYPMFGEPIGNCKEGKEDELVKCNKGKAILEKIAITENRPITMNDINRVCDKLNIE